MRLFFSSFSLWWVIVSVKISLFILHPVTLLASFISSNSFCVEAVRFYIYSITSSAKGDHFTSSLPIWILLFLVWLLWLGLLILCWIEVVRVNIPVLFLNLAEGFQLFTFECYVGCGFVVNGFYYVETCSVCTLFGENVYHKWVLNFPNVFSAPVGMIMWFLPFLLLICCVILVDLCVLHHPYCSGMNRGW